MPLYTFAIVTVDARSDMQYLHDRMPVVLEPGGPLPSPNLFRSPGAKVPISNDGWTPRKDSQKKYNLYCNPSPSH